MAVEANVMQVAIAYHEAGHAVMAYICGREIQQVTIEPREPESGTIESNGESVEVVTDEGYGGRIEYCDGEEVENLLAHTYYLLGIDNGINNCGIWLKEHPEATLAIHRVILSQMAGYIAQGMGVPGSVELYMWEGDKRAICESLPVYQVTNPNYGWDEAERETQAALRDNWSLVTRLMNALLVRRTLSGEEVQRLLSHTETSSMA